MPRCSHARAIRFRMDGTTDIECNDCGATLSDRFVAERLGITSAALFEQRRVVSLSYAIEFPIPPLDRLRAG